MVKNTQVTIQKFPQIKTLAKVLLHVHVHVTHNSYTQVSNRILQWSAALTFRYTVHGKTMVSRISFPVNLANCPFGSPLLYDQSPFSYDHEFVSIQ